MSVDLLLIRPNDQKNIYSTLSEFKAVEPPFWAASIAAYARNRNISVEILDSEVDNLSPEGGVTYIKKKIPNL